MVLFLSWKVKIVSNRLLTQSRNTIKRPIKPSSRAVLRMYPIESPVLQLSGLVGRVLKLADSGRATKAKTEKTRKIWGEEHVLSRGRTGGLRVPAPPILPSLPSLPSLTYGLFLLAWYLRNAMVNDKAGIVPYYPIR